jgi:hypothetical protein
MVVNHMNGSDIMRACTVPLFIMLACLQELDILSTHYIINTLGGCELNPAMMAVVECTWLLIAVKIGYLLLIAAVVLGIEMFITRSREQGIHTLPPWTGVAVLATACLWYAIVVTHNTAAILLC